MNKKKLRLLAIVLVILLVSSGIAAFFILASENKKTSQIKSVLHVSAIASRSQPSTHTDLSMMLGANYTVDNFGVGGTTVSLNSQTPYMNTSVFQNALKFQPNIVNHYAGNQ